MAESQRNQMYRTFAVTEFVSQQEQQAVEENSETFTIQQAIDYLGFGRFQVKMSALAGLCYMADSMEIMMLSILAPVLKCTFDLSGTQQAFLTTAVFLGMCVTSSVWGVLFDKYGRRTMLLFFAVLTGYFGLLSSLSPVYEWVLVSRFLVGCGLAATPQSMTYYSEFLPKKSRGTCVMAIAVVWALGSCLEVLLAMIVVPTLGWRWLLGLTTVPLFLFAAMYKFLPESPYYLMAHGQHDRAMDILHRIARLNGCVLPKGKLRAPDIKNSSKGGVRDLFIPAHLKITLALSVMWVTSSISYYGTALLTTALFENSDGCHGYESSASIEKTSSSCDMLCQSMTSSDYVDLLVTSVGDLPGIALCIFLLSKFGRKLVMTQLLLLYTLVMALCNICAPRIVLVVMLFIARGFINGAAQAGYVYTAEVFPACVRATGLGWCAGVGRVGVMATPFIAQVLIQKSAFIPISMYAALGLLGAFTAFILPLETQNRDMKVLID